jgi:signal transduction histidine kinase
VGDTAAGEARPPGGGAARPADQQLVADVARVAEAVRELVGARAAMVSRVVDDEWLEVMTVVGVPSDGIVDGLRWRRADLELVLTDAEERGRLRVTKRRAIPYAEVPDGTPETGPYGAGHLDLLIAPLRTADAELLGVLATEGPVDLHHPSQGTCDLVELYAEQARLALNALRDHGVLAERLRMSEETVEELLRLNDYRRDLVASITHDLKTPLTAITLNTELLETDRRLGEAGSRPVEAIRRSADRLANLVDDLLAVARMEEGVDGATKIDLVRLVRDACEHAESEATLRDVTFAIESPEELWTVVDGHALARVFANLVANAVKFSLPRGRITLRLARVGDRVEFECTDEGIGIPADRLATLFDLSRRAPDSRIEELPGSGIGLAIAHRIVTRLGGELTVESTQAKGSTFTVRIPG